MITKISIRYWLKNKRKIFLIGVCLVIIMAGIEMAIFLSREDRMLELEGYEGMFDNCIWGQDKDSLDTLKDMKNVTGYGGFYELGFVGKEGLSCLQMVGAFFDEKSQEILHQPCIYGHYPSKDNEISMDINAALRYGITKEQIGKKVNFNLYDSKVKKIDNTDFVLVGLFKSYFGYDAGIYNESGNNDVRMPIVYVHSSKRNIFNTNIATGYITTSEFVSKEDICNFFDSKNISIDKNKMMNTDDFYSQRINAYLSMMGDLEHKFIGGKKVSPLEEDPRTRYGQKQLDEIVDNNMSNESSISSMISKSVFIIIVLSIFIFLGIQKNILDDRRNNIAIIRSLGCSKKRIMVGLCVEMLVIISVFSTIGIFLGNKLYDIIFVFRNKKNSLFLQNAKLANKYVISVTKDPNVYPIFIALVLFVMSCLVYVYIDKKNIILNFVKTFINRHRDESKGKSKNKIKHKKLCGLFLVNRKFRLSSRLVLIIVCIGMLSISFFRIYADGFVKYHYMRNTSNNEYEYQMFSQSGDLYGADIENRYLYGISMDLINNMINKYNIKDYSTIVFDRSFKMSVDNEELKKMPKCLKDLEYMKKMENKYKDTDIVKIKQEKLKKEFEAMGYKEDENILEMPLVGLSKNDVSNMERYVVEGKIDMDKLQSGEEMLAFVNKEYYRKVKNYFAVGKDRDFSDCILNEHARKISFEDEDYKGSNMLLYFDSTLDKVYESNEKSVTKYDGEVGYDLGKKKDIKTKIGAIVVLDEELVDKYMTRNSYSDIDRPIVNIACLDKTFSNIGLMDNKYNYVGINTNNDVDRLSFATEWFETSKNNGRDGIEFIMDNTYKKVLLNNKKEVFSNIFDCLSIIILIISIVGILLLLYLKLNLKIKGILTLKALGMENWQLTRIIIRQNISIPIVASIIVGVSAFVFNKCMIHERYLEEIGDSTNSGMPYYVDFLQNEFWYRLLIAFGIYAVVMVIGIVVQMILLKKHTIISEMNKDNL